MKASLIFIIILFFQVPLSKAPLATGIVCTKDALLPHLSYSFSYDGITCGLGFVDSTKAKHTNPSPMSVPTNDTLDYSDCAQKAWATSLLSQGDDNQKTYDSSRFIIDHCYPYNRLEGIRLGSFFGEAGGALQYISNDPNRWPPFRDWLKKVLYYNLDSNYYCSDVDAILATMQYFNAERGYDRNGALAIVKFLADSHRCPGMIDSNTWSITRSEQYTDWRDSSHSGHINPLDTTLPSLEGLDLQILRGPQFAAVKDAFTPSTKTKLEYFTVSENPFKEETTLRFGLADAEYMKIEIYDLLGNKVYSDSKLFGEGDEEWRIDGKLFERGTLYARLMAMNGEIKTVKLVHEK